MRQRNGSAYTAKQAREESRPAAESAISKLYLPQPQTSRVLKRVLSARLGQVVPNKVFGIATQRIGQHVVVVWVGTKASLGALPREIHHEWWGTFRLIHLASHDTPSHVLQTVSQGTKHSNPFYGHRGLPESDPFTEILLQRWRE